MDSNNTAASTEYPPRLLFPGRPLLRPTVGCTGCLANLLPNHRRRRLVQPAMELFGRWGGHHERANADWCRNWLYLWRLVFRYLRLMDGTT